VLDLEEAKTAQAKEIASLKKRVKKLEKRRKSKPEDASKQEKSIEDIDKDAEVTLVDETQDSVSSILVGILPLLHSSPLYLRTAISNYGVSLGYNVASSTVESFVNSFKMLENQENDKSRSDKRHHVVPQPYTGNYMPPKPDLMFMDDKVESKPQQKEYKEKGVTDNGYSRHMIGNKSYLTEYEDYNGGFVSFGDGKGKISSKGKIKTGTLDFDDVYFCKELKYNPFSVSQMCDKKNNVIFTDTGFLVVSSSFKLLDESQVLLRFSRKDNI
nr:hypothetical protein [Tanacetum cinerariifolium]